MKDAERMLLEDAIEQAIESEKAKLKMKRWLFILALACFLLLMYILFIK